MNDHRERGAAAADPSTMRTEPRAAPGGAKKRRRWVRVLIVVLLAILLIIGIAAVALYPTFRSPPQADYPAAASRAQARSQDIDYLRRVMEIDRSFSASQRKAFEARLTEIGRRAAAMDDAPFEMELARAVALADNGHTNVRGAAWGLSLNSVPLRFAWFDEGLFVVSGAPEHAQLMGARVLRIEGRNPADVASAINPFIGGPDNLVFELSPHLMSSPAGLHAIGMAAAPDALRIEFELRGGERVSERISATPVPVNGPPTEDPALRTRREIHWPRRNLSPVDSPVHPNPWTHLLAETELPLFLQNPDRFYWHTFLADGEVLYVQINANRNEEGGIGLATFLTGVLAEARQQGIRDAIVDLRFNAGGNYQLAADFAERLPELLPNDGRLYIVTSANTWSAGLVTAARLKYFGGDKARIVGERVGDREQFWAEGRGARFPNLGLRFDYSTAYHDWANGCSIVQIFTCFFMNYQIGVAAGSLSPDIPAPISFRDYVVGADTVMLAIEKDLRPRNRLGER